MSPVVLVIGGGYGGIAAAKALDDTAQVILVEPGETFVHHVAALRALVDPHWAERVFLPYDGLLERGEVRRDRVTAVSATDHTVTAALASGERLEADFAILATGSTPPFPARIDQADSASARRRLRESREALAQAGTVLLLGAGPVGLELAGEIRAAWPDTAVTVVDPVPDILAGRHPEPFRAELRRQLRELDVHLLLGAPLAAEPPTPAGELARFTATTTDGRTLSADLWYRCHGGAPATDYLRGDLAAARRPDGHLTVTEELRIPGLPHVFAIGDITTVPETKLAKAAELHAEVAAANIRAEITQTGDPRVYTPGPPGMSLPLGPTGGASYNAALGVLGADRTAELKGAHLRLDLYRARLGLP
ncbi:FAD-dependent oxidoreductase [Streptomyces sp. NPDC005438]|uniref:FAD-dependent oxidoreductase n=1 Tax=Streptomyces sp. NPDC005438 TaxID=3156880 RepID=UPI00339F47F1